MDEEQLLNSAVALNSHQTISLNIPKSTKSTSPDVDPPCTCHAQLKPSHCGEATSLQPRPCWISAWSSGQLKFHPVLRGQNNFVQVGDTQSLKVIHKVQLLIKDYRFVSWSLEDAISKCSDMEEEGDHQQCYKPLQHDQVIKELDVQKVILL